MTTELALIHSEQPQPFKSYTCTTCKTEIREETMHGWVRSRHFGPETNWKQTILPCPDCSEHAIARVRSEQVERLLGASQLPYYARNWSFATTPGDVDQVAIATCANFATQHREKRGIYLHGDPGGGKTGLAISIIQAVMSRGIDAAFIRSIDLVNRLREAIAKGTHDGDELLQLVKRVRWLALDDLATERPTPYVIEQLYAVIEERRSCGLYTVITSNFNLRELEAHWRPESIKSGAFHAGQRVLERIAEYCEDVAVRGCNLRRSATDEGKVRPIR